MKKIFLSGEEISKSVLATILLLKTHQIFLELAFAYRKANI